MPSQPDSNLYEYAIVRYIPTVERGERINIGLVMMCKRRRWLRAYIRLDHERIRAIFPQADIEAIEEQTRSFEAIAGGCDGPIGSLDAHERFRWLTAVRSACICTSRPHPGICTDLDDTFSRLCAELV